MGYVLAYPGVMEHAEQIALSLQEDGVLEAFVTAFAFKEPSALAAATSLLPNRLRARTLTQLRRRSVRNVDPHLVRTISTLEIVRTLLDKAGAGAIAVDRAWDLGSHHFDRTVARRYVPGSEGVLAFEYVALESLRRARRWAFRRSCTSPRSKTAAIAR